MKYRLNKDDQIERNIKPIGIISELVGFYRYVIVIIIKEVLAKPFKILSTPFVLFFIIIYYIIRIPLALPAIFNIILQLVKSTSSSSLLRVQKLYKFENLIDQNRKEEILGDIYEYRVELKNQNFHNAKIELIIFKHKVLIIINLVKQKLVTWISEQIKMSS